MIIPKHKVCDICRQDIPVRSRCYKIPYKAMYEAFGCSLIEHGKCDICERCMDRLMHYVRIEVERESNDK